MRGEHISIRLTKMMRQRFIPACAGNTASAFLLRLSPSGSSPHARGTLTSIASICGACTVHPRMRGEHYRCLYRCLYRSGSSPHARGTHINSFIRYYCWLVHPRMRGEHRNIRKAKREVTGSSPHARGTPPLALILHCHSSVHPRMRGEHGRHIEDFYTGLRFIPACAGNTYTPIARAAVARGSSPHARGTPLRKGIVPVGNTVHPRMRGEHSTMTTSRPSSVGSSPHARGTLAVLGIFKLRFPGSSPHARGTHFCRG